MSYTEKSSVVTFFFDTGGGAAEIFIGRSGTCGETKHASRQSRVENSDMGVDEQELRG